MNNPVIPVETYRFTPAELNLSARQPGISAFMRIRDGAFSLEATIRSHIDHFDEIIAVHNRSADATPDILARLAAEYGPRLKVWHYLPAVFPPGSEGHKATPADHPQSLVNYYNFALSRTRFSHATKLDDDHVAMGDATAQLVADVHAGRAGQGEMACFSGLNLARDASGLGILCSEPFSGSGDIGIFPVGPETYFVHDPRFERFRPVLRRRFHSIVYWHLKYLKPEFGFANYDLADNPQSRYAKRLVRLRSDHAVSELAALSDTKASGLGGWLAEHGLLAPERDRIIAARARAARQLATTPLETLMARDPELAPFLAIPDSA